MALFVLVTEECKKDARRHALTQALERFGEKVEACQHVRLFDHYPPPYIVKKKFGGRQGRLIATHHPVGEHVVVCFLAIMIRGDKAYEDDFTNDPVGYGRRHFAHPSSDNLQTLVAERTAVAPPREFPSPSAEEYTYLYPARAEEPELGTDFVVCESARWVQATGEAHVQDRLALLWNTLASALSTDAVDGILRVPNRPDLGILYRRFPERRTLFLACPITRETPQEEVQKAKEDYRDLLTTPEVTLEQIRRRCRRAYPSLILADESLWIALEKDREGNMALSPEEIRILGSSGDASVAFPLFINGRAGSGKSTILQYLFAEFLYSHLTSGGITELHPPIYFTCSADLLRQSRRMVETIIRCNAKWWHDEGRSTLFTQHEELVSRSFLEFHKFLHALLPADERTGRFRRDRRVDFARFKAMWSARFGQDRAAVEEYGPDLSWHVIRSYVKGLSSDDLIDPDEYRQIERKQRSVTHETYRRVYEKVWQSWYQRQCDEFGFWDDQDLARFLLDKELVKPLAPAIFCDESQDFTRLELELIVRLSLFSERKLAPKEIARVPFVFAGDPFQTLNPTGFRWEATKAAFVEKFIFALDPARQSGLSDLNYQELSFNYRSSRNIVRFCNLIQALRVRLFDITNVAPQAAWEDETHPPLVTWFKRDDESFWRRFAQEKDVIVIVPCAQGEEVDYVRKDATLTSKVKIEDGVAVNVLSAEQAKGLEFPRVVVYGFGEQASDALLAPLSSGLAHSENRDAALPLEYFMNRLYVAASRPKRRLFIVDSTTGFEKLWRFAADERLQTQIVSNIRDGAEVWAKQVDGMVQGNVNDLSMDRSLDPEENARKFEALGGARKDAGLLRQAAIAYRNANNNNKTIECKARALVIEGEHAEAGSMFLDVGLTPDAVRAFWNGKEKGQERLVRAADANSEIAKTIEYAFASYLRGQKNFKLGVNILRQFVGLLEDEEQAATFAASQTWLEAVRQVLGTIRECSSEEAQPSPWPEVAGLCEVMRNTCFQADPTEVAHAYFRSGNFRKAVELWDAAGHKTGQEYKKAVANISPYPQKLVPLQELGEWQTIITEAESNAGTELSAESSRIVALAYLSIAEARPSQGMLFALRARDPQLLGLVATTAHARSDTATAERALRALVVLHALQGEWEQLQEWITDGRFGTIRQPASVFSAWMAQCKPMLDTALARALARSDALTSLTWDDKKSRTNQRPFAECLARTFMQGGLAWIETIPAQEIGGAIERAGSRRDSLVFYEAVRKAKVSPEVHRFAKERWIVCKERQAKFESTEGREKNADNYMTEARIERQGLALTLDAKLPEYPPLDSLENLYLSDPQPKAVVVPVLSAATPSAETEKDQGPAVPQAEKPPKKPDRVTWRVGDVGFDYFVEQGKVNIQHEQTGAQAGIRLKENRCVGVEVAFVQPEGKAGVFKCEDWGMMVEISDAESDVLAVIRFDRLGVAVQIMRPQ